MLFPDYVPMTKGTLEMSHLFSQIGFYGQISLGNSFLGILVQLQYTLTMKSFVGGKS